MTTHHYRPASRWCPVCARHVPASQMRVHVGRGEYQELKTCKRCQSSSRIASARALGAVYQGGRP